jgi:signal transduction histidine kinase
MMIQTEKMMSVGGLAAGMAHEINNPLGIMMQAVQNIERRVAPDLPANSRVAEECGTTVEIIQTYLEKRMVLALIADIREAGARAAKIVANMLQFSRRSESALQYAKVAELVDQTIELAANDYDLKKKYDFRHIEIKREYADDLPEVKLVTTEFEQVILNLLKNSAQAMGDQPDKDKKPVISIRLSADSTTFRFEVEDNGPGMEKAVRKRVFEPFFTTKPVGSGTGLGLSVSYMIITNNHKGSMEVESVVGLGTIFTISLPLG